MVWSRFAGGVQEPLETSSRYVVHVEEHALGGFG
jgi:hypothetical protein